MFKVPGTSKELSEPPDKRRRLDNEEIGWDDEDNEEDFLLSQINIDDLTSAAGPPVNNNMSDTSCTQHTIKRQACNNTKESSNKQKTNIMSHNFHLNGAGMSQGISSQSQSFTQSYSRQNVSGPVELKAVLEEEKRKCSDYKKKLAALSSARYTFEGEIKILRKNTSEKDEEISQLRQEFSRQKATQLKQQSEHEQQIKRMQDNFETQLKFKDNELTMAQNQLRRWEKVVVRSTAAGQMSQSITDSQFSQSYASPRKKRPPVGLPKNPDDFLIQFSPPRKKAPPAASNASSSSGSIANTNLATITSAAAVSKEPPKAEVRYTRSPAMRLSKYTGCQSTLAQLSTQVKCASSSANCISSSKVAIKTLAQNKHRLNKATTSNRLSYLKNNRSPQPSTMPDCGSKCNTEDTYVYGKKCDTTRNNAAIVQCNTSTSKKQQNTLKPHSSTNYVPNASANAKEILLAESSTNATHMHTGLLSLLHARYTHRQLTCCSVKYKYVKPAPKRGFKQVDVVPEFADHVIASDLHYELAMSSVSTNVVSVSVDHAAYLLPLLDDYLHLYGNLVQHIVPTDKDSSGGGHSSSGGTTDHSSADSTPGSCSGGDESADSLTLFITSLSTESLHTYTRNCKTLASDALCALHMIIASCPKLCDYIVAPTNEKAKQVHAENLEWKCNKEALCKHTRILQHVMALATIKPRVGSAAEPLVIRSAVQVLASLARHCAKTKLDKFRPLLKNKILRNLFAANSKLALAQNRGSCIIYALDLAKALLCSQYLLNITCGNDCVLQSIYVRFSEEKYDLSTLHLLLIAKKFMSLLTTTISSHQFGATRLFHTECQCRVYILRAVLTQLKIVNNVMTVNQNNNIIIPDVETVSPLAAAAPDAMSVTSVSAATRATIASHVIKQGVCVLHALHCHNKYLLVHCMTKKVGYDYAYVFCQLDELLRSNKLYTEKDVLMLQEVWEAVQQYQEEQNSM